MFADPTQIQSQLSRWLGNLPDEAQALVADQISPLAQQTMGALTWGTVIAYPATGQVRRARRIRHRLGS